MKDYQMEYDIPNEMRWDDTRRSPPRERRGPNYRSDPSYRRQSEESWEAESRRQPLRRGTRHGNYSRDSLVNRDAHQRDNYRNDNGAW
jgi:hypothetical protein